MNLAEWSVLAAACLAGALSPGPSMALVMLHASQSWRAGLSCAWAHALGVGVYAALAVTGLAWLLNSRLWIQAALSLAAAMWLMRLAYLTLLSAGNTVPQARSQYSAVRDGLSMGLLNPKVAIFFAALFTAALPDRPSVMAAGLAVATAVSIDGLWYSFLTALLQQKGLNAALRSRLSLLSQLSAGLLLSFSLVLLGRVFIQALNA